MPVTADLRPSLLSRYSVLIIDEAHERTLDTDLVLGLAKSIQRERKQLREEWRKAMEDGKGKEDGSERQPPPPELKIIVMSATLDAHKFADFFSTPDASARMQPAPIVYVRGRQHAVNVFFSEQICEDWMDAALKTILQIHLQQPLGDVLVFLTGQEEIEKMKAQLESYAKELPAWFEFVKQVEEEQATLQADPEHPKANKRAKAKGKLAPLCDLLILPMYAALGAEASLAAFQPTPANTRKVVLATNIAETSVTIPGIKYVVDPGLAKIKGYSSATSIEILETQPISQSSAVQRAGRAGRDGPGSCFHLYPKAEFEKFEESPTPDILKVDLANACLQLCAVGRNPADFDFIDAPDKMELSMTMTRLVQLGAIAFRGNEAPEGQEQAGSPVQITPIGAKMALLPLSPSYARILLAAADISPTTARQARDLVAILSADRGIFVEPNDSERKDAATRARASLAHPSGDHATYLTVFYQFLSVGEQARKQAQSEKVAREEIKSWCEKHWVHHRTMQSILSIRSQLQRICKQRNIVCDDEERSGKMSSRDSSALPPSQRDEDEEEEMGSSAAADGLYVTRPGQDATNANSWQSLHDERYEQLRRALLPARLSNFAFKASDGKSYKRGDSVRTRACTSHSTFPDI